MLLYVQFNYLSDEICELAVRQNGLALQYVKNQTDKICKLAVQQYGFALQYVKNKTNEIKVEAYKQNDNIIFR